MRINECVNKCIYFFPDFLKKKLNLCYFDKHKVIFIAKTILLYFILFFLYNNFFKKKFRNFLFAMHKNNK